MAQRKPRILPGEFESTLIQGQSSKYSHYSMRFPLKGMKWKLEKDVLLFCNVSLGSKLRLKCFVFPMGR